MRNKSIYIVFAFFVVQVQAQINFKATYSYPGSDFGVAGMAVSGSETVIMDVVYTNNHNILLTKVDQFGSVQWSYDYGDSSVDAGRSIISTSDGGYLVTGISVTNAQAAMVLKVDSAGDIQWQKKFGDTLKLEATGAIQLSDNGYVILARDSGYYHYGLYLLRMDSTGNSVWMKRFDDGFVLNPIKIIKLNGSDDFFVAGERTTGGSSYPFAFRMDESGNMIWCKYFIQWTSSDVTAAAVGPTNRLYLSSYNSFFYFIELDENGAVLHIHDNGHGDACGFHNIVTNILPLSNGLVVCTVTFSCGGEYLAYFDTSGNEIGGIESPFNDLRQALVTDDQDFIYLQKNFSATPDDILTKSNLTLSNSCFNVYYYPPLYVADTATGINFTLNQFSFSGLYLLLFSKNNHTVSSNISCTGDCRVSSLFHHPDLFLGYVCKNNPVTFANFSFNASSYQWYVDSLPVSSGPDLNYTFTNIGSYHISLVAADSLCSDSTGMMIQVRDIPVAQFTVTPMTGNTFRFDLPPGIYTHFTMEYGDGTLFNGMATSTAIHTYPGPGTYQCCLYAWNHCGVDSTCQAIVIIPTGIPEISNSLQLTVSPNPFHDQSLISFSNSANYPVTLKILDATGQSILDKKITSDHFLFERNALGAGIYLVMLFDGNNQLITTKKLIIN